MNPTEVLKHYWGYDSFREKQADIIQAVLDGKNTIALLPTGGGKSICFQVPALCMEGLCIVISPLIALMKDQISQLQKRGILSRAIYSGMTKKEIDITLDNCIYGDIKFLYVSPERLKTKIFQDRLPRMNVNMVAIDEAHCISQWGYDFRPAYLQINELFEELPHARKIALTATATKEVKNDILEKLEMNDAFVFQKSFARSNLSYSVFQLETKEQKLLEILSRVGGSSIVYARTRRRTQEISSFLKSHRVSVDFYHAGLTGQDRARKQDDWIKNKTRVIVSTNAFGMGIDKPDVRTVVHLDVPDSLEAYYQEAGRVGRDEKMAFAVILFNRSDISDLMKRAESREVSKAYCQQVYQSLANFFKMAVGSHGMESLSFDLSTFSRSFDLVPMELMKALRNLEESGIIQLSEEVYARSSLHITVGKEELYRYEVENIKFEALIKTVLRLYGGELLQDYRNIKEADVARLAKLPLDQVKKQLMYLSEQGILDYKPMNDSQTITFLVPRMVANELPIDSKLIKFRQNNAIQKAKIMRSYLETQSMCRTRVFQGYFDEETLDNCGVCDFCLNQKKNRSGVPINEVLIAVEEGADAISILYKKIKTHRHEQIMLAVRILIEDGKIKMEEEKIFKI